MTVFEPTSEEQVSDIVREAVSARRTLQVRGGGTRAVYPADTEDTLNTQGLAGVSLYEPGALTMVVGAGTPLDEVEALLETENQRLAFEPWDARSLTGSNGRPTIGGMVATNASGPRRIQAGACRDSILGVRFIDGAGTTIKNGGRVMKNVTGLDLVKLLTGSRGTLGVITEVALKVSPKPEVVSTLVLDGLDVPDAVGAMTAAMTTPFEVTASAHAPDGLEDKPVTLFRLEGFEASVRYRAGELAKALARFGAGRVIEGPGHWRDVRDASMFSDQSGAVWRISVKPTDGVRVGAALPQARLLFDSSGGLVWALTPETLDVRAALAGIPGHATLVRGSAEAQARWGVLNPEPAPLAALSAGLRKRFDPHGVFRSEQASDPSLAAIEAEA